MNIIQQPDSLSLSQNLKDFLITSDVQISFVLKQGDVEILSQRYDPPTKGNISIDVRDIIHERLSYTLKDSSTVYQQFSLVDNFTAVIDSTEVTFRVIRSGVDRIADSATNFLTHNFLTWQPSVKPATYYSPEFLTYYAVISGTIKLRAYFTDNSGTVTSQTDYTIVDVLPSIAYTIPLQYSVVAGWLGHKLPAYYDVWGENTSGQRLTYIQRYYAEDMRSEQEQWILFENSLGGLDTFRAYGNTTLNGEHTHNLAEIDEVSQEYRVDTERNFQKNTGHLNNDERKWLLDFFPSKGKYCYTGNYLRPIVVVESNVSYTDKELPSNYTFTFKFADARPLLNLPRTDVPADVLNITVPSVGSFTVPPRLAEFPHLPLSEGALFPIQNPYSEEWATTTIDAIGNFLADFLSNSYGSGGGVGHQHRNFNLLQLLSYIEGYLLVNGQKIKAGYADKAGSVDGMDDIFLHKDRIDQTNFLITFLKGLLIGENGSGITVLPDGKSQAVVDYLYVKVKAIFDELEVKKKTYVGGEQILTPAGMKCIRVEELPDAWRCYFKAEEDGVEIENTFTPGTLAISQENNIKVGVSHHVSNRYYWREVTAVGTDYIDLSKTKCDPNIENDIPAAGDDIVGLGHSTDITRQGAIVLSSVNEVAPSILMYQGINDFSLAGKDVIGFDFDKATGKARMRVYGDAYIGAKDRSSYIEYTQEGLESKGKFISAATGKNMDESFSDIFSDLDKVKAQTDKEYTLWFFDYEPSLSNIPAVEWDTEELKSNHEHDMFYNSASGFAYRFELNVDGFYSWNSITDQQTVKALENASKAQDTADGKRRGFVSQPTDAQAYDIGDLWVNVTYPSTAPHTYEDDTLVCKTSKYKGEAFDISHWKPAAKYTTSEIKNLGDSILLIVEQNKGDAEKLISAVQSTANSALSAAGTALSTANSAQSAASSNATAIQQTKDDILILAGRFNSDGTLKNTSGLVVTADFANLFSQAADENGLVKRADISTFITRDQAGNLISNATIQADKINFLGKTTINGNFVVDIEGNVTMNNATVTGTIIANNGKIGGFKISGNGLTNANDDGKFTNDAYIIFRNDPHGCFAGIGGNILPATSGLRGVARFENHDKSDWWGLGSNYAMLVSAQGAEENCAIAFNGGYMSGVALKIQTINSDTTISRDAVCVELINTSNITVNLPDMETYDDGHVIIVKRMGSGAVRLITGYGKQINGQRTRNTFSSTPLLEKNVGDGEALRLIYSRGLSNYSGYSGCWIYF